MLTTSRSRRLGIAYVVLVAVSLLLLAFSSSAPLLEVRRGVGFALAPIQEGLRDGARQVSSLFGALAEIDRLRSENQELQQRVHELEAANRNLEALRSENEELSELLALRSSFAYTTVAGEVISRYSSQLERVVTLDRGSDHGISEGDPVVAGGGALVGQVEEVGRNFSRLLLLNDSRVVVIGLVEGSRATGEVRGQLERPLIMERIEATDAVEIGESVVTAGIDLGEGIRSPFPKGLLIGTVVDVLRPPNQVLQTALLQPAAPLDRLEYVLVIIDYDGGLPIDPPEASPDPAP